MEDRELLKIWTSAFTGITVISNRKTPAHRDRGAAFQDYDILSSVGTHRLAKLLIHDFGVPFAYGPGTVVALCGRFLQHEVPEWEEGERVCYAHFMKRKVLEKLRSGAREWVTLDMFK